MDNFLDSEEVAQLHLDVQEVTVPISAFLANPQQDPSLLLIHSVALDELLISLNFLVLRLHSRIFDSIVSPLRQLEATLKGVEQSSAEQADASTDLRQEWIKSDSGQWKITVPHDLLLELVEMGFGDRDCAVFLGCSERTVRRRRAELGIKRRDSSDLSFEEVVNLLRRLRTMHSNSVGERGTWGALRAMGVRISRARMREAIRTIDPIAVNSRWTRYLKRREYFVPFVNSLWHMDGHHKLIRWKIVIHGAIDGKSRIVTYLQAAGNNRADTVAKLFLGGVAGRGWPSRVRGDHGGENVKVMELMEEVRGM
ncbi:hypothetical protein CF327_g7573 [Tilletia walkeri]|nr:hypothetical protein CF327_g7573 [Tilletia walkeri]